jgi:hypothetical protein
MSTENKFGAACFGAHLGGAATPFLQLGHHLRSQTTWLRLMVIALPVAAVSAGGAAHANAEETLAFVDPYVFVDRFEDTAEVKALDFATGPKPFLTLGIVVEKDKAEQAGTPVDIVKATASNGKVTFDLVYADIGILDLWDNWRDGLPEFDPETHKGTWVITATDSKGGTKTTSPVMLDHGFTLPFVEDAHGEKTASGDLQVTWMAPKLDPEMQETCDVDYRVRLLIDGDHQLYRSSPTTETSLTIPADTVMAKFGDSLENIWGRIEMGCRDRNEKNADGLGELEARSNTFFPLT